MSNYIPKFARKLDEHRLRFKRATVVYPAIIWRIRNFRQEFFNVFTPIERIEFRALAEEPKNSLFLLPESAGRFVVFDEHCFVRIACRFTPNFDLQVDVSQFQMEKKKGVEQWHL